MNENILIVEDDPHIIEGLSDILSGYGYETLSAKNQKETFQILEAQRVDLIILDVTLGRENGYELCKQIRRTMDCPILFLTGRNSEIELIRGFQVGGDDYVTKPFRLQELIVRIQALLRRSTKTNHKQFLSGDLLFDTGKYQVYRETTLLELTATQMRLVFALVSSWPNTLTRDQLLYQTWDYQDEFVNENTLNVNISRLRERLGSFGEQTYIITMRGVGYRWGVPVRKGV